MQQSSNSSDPPSPTSNPVSDAAQAKAPSTLPKDRPCPFCNQAFTSSSLGRHLDLYIRDKNPKPPDGIHDVDQIRGMRGRITRRQPKGSAAVVPHTGAAGHKRKASAEAVESPATPAEYLDDRHEVNADVLHQKESHFTRPPSHRAATDGAAPASDEHRRSMTARAVPPRANSTQSVTAQVQQQVENIDSANGLPNVHAAQFASSPLPTSRMGWQATGVIGGLPNTLRSPPGTRSRTIPASGQALPDERAALVVPSMLKNYSAPVAESGDTKSVATAALRDILNALQRSQTRISRPTAFDFDPLAFNYPALCLRILSPPDSLFSSTPMEPATNGAAHWPLSAPPSAAHKTKLAHNIRVRLRMHTSLCPPPELRFAQSRQEVEDGIAAEVDKLCAMYCAHVEAALKQWEDFSQPTREEIWKLEMLRFCASQASETHELENKLEKTQDFVEELRGELSKVREAYMHLKAQNNGEGGPAMRFGSLNGSLDAAQPSVGSLVDSALSKEMEATWAASRMHPGGGWMEGVGPSKWDFDSVIKRYRALINGGGTPQALYPGEAWRKSHEMRNQGGSNDTQGSRPVDMQTPLPDANALVDSTLIVDSRSNGNVPNRSGPFDRGGFG